jgi:serine/threonine-protein kinase
LSDAKASNPAPASIQFGEYTVFGRLGEGGMCHVFRARRSGEIEDCALKMLKEDQRKDERVLDLFVTEADLSLLLRHPNLVTTFDAGEIKDRYYIAMELIEGSNLRDCAAQCERIGVPLPPDFALAMLSEVLAGLAALHDAKGSSGTPLGLIHRDVTPHNIFLAFDGRVILGDFGIAQIKAYGDIDPGQGAVGKLGYLAPEAVAGEEVDHRADLFAIGVILHELLTGTRLFASGTDQEILQAILEVRAPKPRKIRPTLSKGLEAVMQKALARKPKERYQTAQEMIDALRPFWSPLIGHQAALSGFLSGLFRDESQALKRSSWIPPPPR